MNIRMTIGFIVGALVVVGLWWMLQHNGIEEKDMAAGSMNPETTQNEGQEIKAVSDLASPAPENNADPTTIIPKTADETLNRLPEETQTAVLHIQPEPPGTDPEIAQKDEPEAPSMVSETTEPIAPEETGNSTESDLVQETRDVEKYFFWKPFFLKSKAEKFAGFISDQSGVDCRVEKTGMAKYQVYYLYDDATDQAAKTALIQNTGLKF
nr:hypothetical protein [uncultured Desulfobacter sp.]